MEPVPVKIINEQSKATIWHFNNLIGIIKTGQKCRTLGISTSNSKFGTLPPILGSLKAELKSENFPNLPDVWTLGFFMFLNIRKTIHFNWWMEKLKRSGLSYKVASYACYGNNVVFKTVRYTTYIKNIKLEIIY